MAGKVVDGTGWKYTIIDNEIVETQILDIYEKMLYIALKRFANIQTGEAFPGVKKLAAMAGMSERKARGVINMLTYKRFIKVEHRKNKTSVYTLLPLPAQYAGGAQDAVGHAPHAGGVMHTVQGGGARGADELKRTELKRTELKKDNEKFDVADAPVPFIELFEEWWSLYNKKLGRKKCETTYKRLLKKYSHEEMINGTKKYLQHMKSLLSRNEFCPDQKHPSTYLNGEHFNDEYQVGGGNNGIDRRGIPADDAVKSKVETTNERRKRIAGIKSDRDPDNPI